MKGIYTASKVFLRRKRRVSSIWMDPGGGGTQAEPSFLVPGTEALGTCRILTQSRELCDSDQLSQTVGSGSLRPTSWLTFYSGLLGSSDYRILVFLLLIYTRCVLWSFWFGMWFNLVLQYPQCIGQEYDQLPILGDVALWITRMNI